MNEKDLLQQYKMSGELELLGKLFAPYMSLLYAVCYKYLQDSEKSQDAVMQIFESLISKLRLHEVENFKNWLYIFTKNHCLMLLRKDKRAPLVESIHLTQGFELPLETEEDVAWTEENFERLESCLLALNPEQQLCVRLFYLEQKCYKAISEQTGFEINKVKSFIQNGKRNLRICMKGKAHGS